METYQTNLPAASNTLASAGIENVSRPGTPETSEDPKSITNQWTSSFRPTENSVNSSTASTELYSDLEQYMNRT